MAVQRNFLFLLLSLWSFCSSQASLVAPSVACVPEVNLPPTVSWFFRRSKAISVFQVDSLMGHDNNDLVRGFSNHLVQEMFSSPHVPLVTRRVPGDEENPSQLFSHSSSVLVIADSLATVRTLLGNITRDVNINADFMFVIVQHGLDDSDAQLELMASFFRRLWRDFNVLNAILVVSQCSRAEQGLIGDPQVVFFDPFAYVGGFEANSDLNYGRLYAKQLSQLLDHDRDFLTKRYVKDFHGYPIKVNQFFRYPTAIDRKTIPVPAQSSYIYAQYTKSGERRIHSLLAE